MPVMIEDRSDDRIDALSAKVDDLGAQMERGFERVDVELREWRQEMRAGFARVDERFARVDERFEQIDDRFHRIDDRLERIDERFDRIQLLMIQFCGLMLAALIGLIATQL